MDGTFVSSKIVQKFIQEVKEEKQMMTKQRWIILAIIIIVGFIFGRLAVRAVLNFMLGGTLFGGNFL